MFAQKEKDYLLKIARRSVEAGVKGEEPPKIVSCPEALMNPSGAFVTIPTFKELRGCIGWTESAEPLVETVIAVAAKAALEDPRFNPLTAEELEDVEIEISVLSPMKEIKDVNELEKRRCKNFYF